MIFLFPLVCFCRRSLRMRVERPTGPPPQARWRAPPPPRPASLGARLRTPGLQTCASPLATPARQLGEHLARPHPVSSSLSSKSQTRRRAPEVSTSPPPRSRSAPFHPRGCPSHSFLKHPSALWGAENPPGLGRPGPKLSKGKKVKGEAGGHKQIFFFPS